MAKTGRPYKVTAPAGVSVVKADDHVQTKVDLPPLATPRRMGQLLRDELTNRGFRDGEGGNIVRERGGVRTTLNPETGDMKIEAGGEVQVPPAPPSVCGCRIASQLATAERLAGELQKEVTGRLLKAIPGIGCEVEGAVNRASKKAILETAHQLGQVKQVHEGQDGSLTVVVEV